MAARGLPLSNTTCIFGNRWIFAALSPSPYPSLSYRCLRHNANLTATSDHSVIEQGFFQSNQNRLFGTLKRHQTYIYDFSEGVGVLPGPVTGLHATNIGDGEVTLVWQAPNNGTNVTQYQLHYQSVDKHSASQAVFALNNVSLCLVLLC